MIINSLVFILSVSIYFLIYFNREKISKKLSVQDIPDETRKIHKFPTPKTASYSMALLFLMFLISNYLFKFYNLTDINFLVLGTIMIFFIGYFDDKYKLSALNKIILVSLVTLMICMISDKFIIDKFYIKTFDFFFKLEEFSIIFTILCVLCLVNALNLADGINGLAIGIVFFWLIYLNQIYTNNIDNFIFFIIFTNLILIFFHNYLGKHFLGDSGSLMFSAFIAFLTIYLHNLNIENPTFLISSESLAIIFLIPIIDMLRLFFERKRNNKDPYSGDNNHLHHYLLKKFSLKYALIIYFMSINIPVILSLYTDINKFVIIVSIILFYIIFLIHYKLGLKNNPNEKN